jgi:hypothetical protein
MNGLKIRWSCALILVGLASGCGPSSPSQPFEAWNPENAPTTIGSQYELRLDALPLSGQSARGLWSASYWESRKAGIAVRWRMPESQNYQYNFTYPLAAEADVRAMSLAQLSRLSPAEKLDIYHGRFDYPMVQAERTRNRPNDPEWVGLCDGWASVNLLFDEPKPTLIRALAGIDIPFSTADFAAYLTYYQARLSTAPLNFLGVRCYESIASNPGAANTPECKDVNAGAFHLVLTNELGLRGAPFLLDLVRDAEVWNHPAQSFTSVKMGERGPSPTAAPGTVREVQMQTTLHYLDVTNPVWGQLGMAKRGAVRYDYYVELNDQGEVIGGEWITSHRPDFLWRKARPNFEQYFAPLSEMLRQSYEGDALPEPI